MNTPAFPAFGTGGKLAPELQRASLSRRVTATRAAIVGAGCLAAVAIVVAGTMYSGTSEPDPTQTAAVPSPHPPVGSASNGAGDTVASKQARQPAPAMRDETVVAAATSRFEPVAAKTPIAPNGAASIAPGQPQPASAASPGDIATGLRGSIDVQVAESEAEVAMLETTTGMIDPSTTTRALDGPLPALRPAKAAKWANLRDGPADESKVILVVPADAAIEAETDCNWCTVVYNGQRGFMYKSLIRRSAAEEASSGQGLF